ncbi:MAG: hypothetical protein V2I66_16735 [Halieaceae bacterium]|nr:hypothetical protein [Halieaceae bacterium]
MRHLYQLLILSSALTLAANSANAADKISINATTSPPLFDGRCDSAEWQPAIQLELPAGVSVKLMHDTNSLYVCAMGKAQDYTVIDLYIEHGQTRQIYNLHASAQLFERVHLDENWSDTSFWNQKDWSAFWVPYAGEEETEKGPRTRFLKGSHREVQVLRRKFPGESWKMMIGISAVEHEGSFGEDFKFPAEAVDTDPSTWAEFSFSR